MSGLGKVLANKFYVDEIYDIGVVAPVEITGTVTDGLIDDIAIKGITDGIGSSPGLLSKWLSRIQNGNIEYYLIYMVVAVSILLAINLF
jgi:NADH-quinone oxidoreductase subunit L